jgi:hypothetical protein
MAPRLLMSSGSRKKEPRYAYLSQAKASHSQRMWAEVSSSAPHLLHNGLSDSPTRWRCLLRVLCPVRRPVTALDCMLLTDRSLALTPRQGPRINSWAYLWVSPRPRHHAQCWLSNQHLILLCVSCLETPKAGSGPTNLRTEPSLTSSLAISLPRTPACPGTQNSPTACWAEVSFNAFWHCRTNGAVLTVSRAFKAAWLSEQILAYFSGLFWNWISWTRAKMAYISAWKTVAYLPREKLSLLPTDCP